MGLIFPTKNILQIGKHLSNSCNLTGIESSRMLNITTEATLYIMSSNEKSPVDYNKQTTNSNEYVINYFPNVLTALRKRYLDLIVVLDVDEPENLGNTRNWRKHSDIN